MPGKYYVLLPLLVGLLFQSCEIINPAEEIPAYVQINKPVFADPLISYPAEQIKDGWLTIDNSDLIGGFELPATVPVLNTGTQKIVSIAPGISSDGLTGVRVEYPFYSVFRQTVDLVPGQVAVVSPRFEYLSNLDFPLNETFDSGSSALTLEALAPHNTQSLKTPYTTNPLAQGGAHYGLIQAQPGQTEPIQWVSQNAKLELPKQGARVYLEINYRSSLPLQIGVRATDYYSSQLTAFPAEKWTKLYVDLLEEVSLAPGNLNEFQLLMKTPNTNASGTDFVALDNVRIVHFRQ